MLLGKIVWLLQYIKLGFPLSLTTTDSLSNTEVTNHFSANQYPDAVQDYLDKEIQLGSILGPVDKVEFDEFHCSPLLTRPKEGNKRRIILDLSYPKGNSVNDTVNRSYFDGYPFLLKFPTIDDIVNEITKDNCEKDFFKIDIARAPRNLRVDPADAFKFGIQWKGQYYLDISVVFGWVHGSAAFQMLSDAITYIMAWQSFRIFAYIYDFVGVSPTHLSSEAFCALSDLIHRLGLPINEDKRSPPCKALTCLVIHIDLASNVLSIDQEKPSPQPMDTVFVDASLTGIGGMEK